MINIKEFLGLTYYTSKLDEFLAEYDRNHPQRSASQHREITKYARIDTLRDDPHAQDREQKESCWDQ